LNRTPKKQAKKAGIELMDCRWDYDTLKEVLKDEPLPAMIVNLDCLDHNIARIEEVATRFNKKIRIATKSIRVTEIIRYILDKGQAAFSGLMCFSVPEAAFLSKTGFDDILIAYPTCAEADMDLFYRLTKEGINIVLMVDLPEHVHLLTSTWKQRNETDVKAKVCIDVDVSYKPLGLHLGVFRSSVRKLADFEAIFASVNESEHLVLSGIMGYEAQIAGMGEKNPFSPFTNPVKRLIKKLSVKDVKQKRQHIHEFLNNQGVELEFYNGGGTGSLQSTSSEPWITEITVGSGFLQSHLFDYYETNLCKPALSFGLQVSRLPQQGVVTCKSGGFIASGEVSADKSPIPFMPEGIRTIKNEGYGEVQTPLRVPGNAMVNLGDPIFFRPSKAGEIAERFNEYILVRDHKIESRVNTYRGEGQCFY
jgi:D-serine deaminase-like pyridoxal phosphate-dependent protein